jgi:DNA excision repair protein ERCC-3
VTYQPDNPLIVQSDMTMLLEVASPRYEETRDAIVSFAEIVKSPEHVHTYRITPISLWNAASSGISAKEVIDRLTGFSRFEIPQNLIVVIGDIMGRFGKVRIEVDDGDALKITTDDALLMTQLSSTPDVRNLLGPKIGRHAYSLHPANRGLVKQALIRAGFPALDVAGFRQGSPFQLSLRKDLFSLRPYQVMARDAFHRGGSSLGGSGVIALPSGSGKTVVGMSIMALLRTHTLIITTGVTAVRQWIREIIEKTDGDPAFIGEYSGHTKEIRPVTVTTYQILTSRKRKDDEFIHFQTLNNQPWGLIIYDEVHLLPAQVFRFTASLQAVRRLGLTATLIREDGREGDVFSLIGPKCFDMPWKVVEKQGWIAEAACYEIRVPISGEGRIRYVSSSPRQRFRIAAENEEKHRVIERLITLHRGEKTLIIGQYLDQIHLIQARFGAPLITGGTPQAERDALFREFRDGDLSLLIVSSVANFAIDLPDASVAIQVSGKFGSRQEEAQRLGRILRPKADGRQAQFYTVVTRDTEEQDFALKRQLFLTEQGYTYVVLDEEEMDGMGGDPSSADGFIASSTVNGVLPFKRPHRD